MKTQVSIHPAKAVMIVKQGEVELSIPLSDIDLRIIGVPSKEQLQAQPLALMTLITAMIQSGQ